MRRERRTVTSTKKQRHVHRVRTSTNRILQNGPLQSVLHVRAGSGRIEQGAFYGWKELGVVFLADFWMKATQRLRVGIVGGGYP